MMMNEYFVPIYLAEMLKEIGFAAENYFGCYLDSQAGYSFQEYLYPVRRDACIEAGKEQGFSETIEAPLYDQVIRWLINKQHLFIAISPNWAVRIDFLDDFREMTYDGEVLKVFNHIHLHNEENNDELFCDNFKEAMDAGIRECLNIIKER